MSIYSNEFIDTCSNITPVLLPFLSDVRSLASFNDASPHLRTAIRAAMNSPLCANHVITLEGRESLQLISHPFIAEVLIKTPRVQINALDFEYV